jgi:hypothetical protein
MYLLEVQTPRFTFRSIGKSVRHCRALLRDAWKIHVTQTGAEPDYVNAATDGTVTALVSGTVYRDDAVLVSGGAPPTRAGTPPRRIVERLLQHKYPNAGRYLFTREELIRIIAAVQADASKN